MDIIKRLAGMLKPYRKRVALALFLQLLVILSRLLAPFITRDIVNEVIPSQNLTLLLPLCAELLALVIMRASSTYARSVMLERVSQNVTYDLRTGLYSHLQELPYVFYDTHRIGEIMSRMTGDIEGVRNLIAGGLITVYDNALNFIGALIFLTFMSWQLMLALLIFAPLIALTAWQFNKRIRPAFRNIREQNAALNTRTQENISGVRVVKAFTREDYESEQFDKDNTKLLNLNLEATRIWSIFVPLMELMSSLCTPIMLLVGGVLLVNGQMDIGTLVAVNGYVWLIINPMRALSGIINMVAQAITSAEKLFYYQDFGSVIREKDDARAPEKFEGHVEFDHVTFSYGGEDILTDITFEAKPGQTVAVMGATGAGKSTLVSLIGRFYDVKAGAVRVDGIDVRDQQLKPLRSHLGYVMQETFLFSDTLTDNIRFGRPDAGQDRVERAAQVAQAREFIEHMPQGYETVVGERGMGLSGGQKQRVAIARAVLVDPSILILDDSTSAVDMETEYLIQQELKDVLKNRTTFVIAHRISSVKNADLILVLDGGRIAERGTHQQLLDKKGIYYQMVQDQYRDFDQFARGKAGEA
ncbi:MAG: ABC transporter ATP-binding protein [Clostridia bacterium]|nr:ABC transporter ATP-binding protein [Clostridia bacterium]